MDVVVLLSIVGISALLQGLSGFAFPMLMTMLLALVLPFQQAVAWTIVPAILLNVMSLLQGMPLDRLIKRYALFAGIATLGSVVGVYLLVWVEALWLQLGLALVMVWYVTKAWLQSPTPPTTAMPKWQLYGLGFAAGVVGSATNAMAPLLMIALLALHQPRLETMQVANLCFLLSKLCQWLGLYVGGQWLFEWRDTGMVLAVCVVALGVWLLGFKWQQRLSPVVFQKMVLLVLAGMAVLQLWQALPLLWLKMH